MGRMPAGYDHPSILDDRDITRAHLSASPIGSETSMNDPVRKMEKLLYGCGAVLALMVLALSFLQVPVPRQESYLSFYADFIIKESENWLEYIAAFVLLGGIAVYVVSRTKALGEDGGKESNTFAGKIRAKAGRIPETVLDLLRIAFPIAVNLILFSYVVGYVNAVNRYRLIDTRLAEFDLWLTGTYPFLKLEMIRLPGWLIELTEFSFLNLTFFMVLAAGIMFLRNRKAFSKYAVAFFTSIILMIPLWLLVPVMSPQDRFIDNVYGEKDPPQMTVALNNFKPVPEVESFLKQMRRSKEGLDIMPTTTFPSSHAAWATIALLCLLEASTAAGAIFFPFLLLSTLGTFYFAQHYLIDTPAGILIGIISVMIVSLIFRESSDPPGAAAVRLTKKVDSLNGKRRRQE